MIKEIHQYKDSSNNLYSLTFLIIDKDDSGTEFFSKDREIRYIEYVDDDELSGYKRIYNNED